MLESIASFYHCCPMSTATAHLLQEFERLPVEAQREFSDAILHLTAHFDYEAPSDDELTATAREMFAMLDQEEVNDATAR